MDVPEEFASLRENVVKVERPSSGAELEAAQALTIIHNRAGEIVCTFDAAKLDYGLELRTSQSYGSSTLFKISTGVPIGTTPSIIVGDRTLALAPDRDGISTLHLWIDGSIIELFADSKQVMTIRFYTSIPNPSNIFVRWTGGVDSLSSMTVADIRPISSDRLTS
jgi:hypothetical protein